MAQPIPMSWVDSTPFSEMRSSGTPSHRESFPDSRFRGSKLTERDLRYNFAKNAEGDGAVTNSSTSYMQFLSLTNADDAWRDFQLSVFEDILNESVGFNIDPSLLPELFPIEFGSAATDSGSGSDAGSASASTAAATPTTTTSPTPAPASAAAAVQPTAKVEGAAVLDAVSSSSTDSYSSVVSLLDRYGPVVIGLLAGNLVIMLLLCIIALVACTRGAIRGGAKTRSAPTYVPVAFRDKVVDDPEFNAPVHNYSDQ